MVENVKVQMQKALSFPTSYQLLKLVEDKVVKFCLKNVRFYKIFAAISDGVTGSPKLLFATLSELS